MLVAADVPAGAEVPRRRAGADRGGAAQPHAARRARRARARGLHGRACTSTSASARCRASDVLIASALWGFVRPGGPHPRLPPLDGRDAAADRLAARAVARPAAACGARRGPDRRHALRVPTPRPGSRSSATVVGVRAFVNGKTISPHGQGHARRRRSHPARPASRPRRPDDVASLVRAGGPDPSSCPAADARGRSTSPPDGSVPMAAWSVRQRRPTRAEILIGSSPSPPSRRADLPMAEDPRPAGVLARQGALADDLSRRVLSTRRPRNRGWRRRPAVVHSAKPSWATSSGSTQVASRIAGESANGVVVARERAHAGAEVLERLAVEAGADLAGVAQGAVERRSGRRAARRTPRASRAGR